MRTFTVDGDKYKGFDRNWHDSNLVVIIKDEDSFDIFAIDDAGNLKDFRRYLQDHVPHGSIVGVYNKDKVRY